MLKLYGSIISPFVRKIIITSHFTGHYEQLEVIPADTLNPDDPLRKQNPLGKVPCLILPNGESLYDSRVIVEYLDHESTKANVLPKDWLNRLASLKLQALADGVLDAAVLKVLEGRFRKPENHDANWLSHQDGKINRGFAVLEDYKLNSKEPDIGAITVACLMDWYAFRFSELSAEKYPNLHRFRKEFEVNFPFFLDTKPKS